MDSDVEDNPVHASMSILGRSREMLDSIVTKTKLCSPEINRRLPVHFFGAYDGRNDYHVIILAQNFEFLKSGAKKFTLPKRWGYFRNYDDNLFSVYCAQVSRLCRERMHAFVEDEILRVGYGSGGSNGGGSNLGLEEGWTEAMKKSFEKMNALAISDATCESSGEDCKHSLDWGISLSYSAVAIITLDYIVVANSGGSLRAVLCRAGKPIVLGSYDGDEELFMLDDASTTSSEKELEGYLASADEYEYEDDVEDDLALVVIQEPDVTFTKRETEDECLIIASDGLWNVIANEYACEIASQCLREGDTTLYFTEGNNSLCTSRCLQAATLLTRLALAVRSLDNISVIVIDLKNNN